MNASRDTGWSTSGTAYLWQSGSRNHGSPLHCRRNSRMYLRVWLKVRLKVHCIEEICQLLEFLSRPYKLCSDRKSMNKYFKCPDAWQLQLYFWVCRPICVVQGLICKWILSIDTQKCILCRIYANKISLSAFLQVSETFNALQSTSACIYHPL